MRNFINIVENMHSNNKTSLNEITKTKDKIKLDLKTNNNLGTLATNKTSTNNVPVSPKIKNKKDVTTKISSKQANDISTSMNKLNQMDLGNDEIQPYLGSNDTDDIGTDVAMPKTVNNLPTILGDAGVTFSTEFTSVRDLPGYLANNVRVMARMLWKIFADVKLEDVAVMSSFTGSSIDEIKMMAKWITQNGVLEDSPIVDFSKFFKGYNPEIRLYKSVGFEWLIVHEPKGSPGGEQYYVYTWPGGRGVHLDKPKNNPRIGKK